MDLFTVAQRPRLFSASKLRPHGPLLCLYTNHGGKHRAEGGVIATGDERTCLPDAMSVIYCMLFSISLTHFCAQQEDDCLVLRARQGRPQTRR